MDIRNKNARKTIISLLERPLKLIMTENAPIKSKQIQDQLIRFQNYETQKQSKLMKQNERKPQMRAKSKSDHEQFYQRSQSQLENRNEKLQKSKEQLIQKRLESEISEATFQPQISKYSREKYQNRSGNDIYYSGLKWMQDKANNIENLKESVEISKFQDYNSKPIVNKVSEKILRQSNKNNFYTRLSINEAKKQDNLKKLKREATPSFKPQINKSSNRIQSQLGKDVVHVSVDLDLLDKIRNYSIHLNDRFTTDQKENQQRIMTKNIRELSQSLDLNQKISNISNITEGNDGPSFRVDTTIKKQPKLQVDSPRSTTAERLYEALMDDGDYFNQQYYE